VFVPILIHGITEVFFIIKAALMSGFLLWQEIMTQRTALVNGYIRAVADANNPTQTRLSIILTDFEPNTNKQGIPRSEAENILRTALLSPLKINFTGDGYTGHKGAFPIGAIASAAMGEDNGRDVIAGDAIVWNDIYPEVSDHLKKAFASGIGTSWEIYFKDSKTDANDIEWLEGCVFAGTCIVDVPAYGPNRTRILAIAETLNDRATDLLEKETMAKELETDTTSVETPALAADDVMTLRDDLSSLMTMLTDMYSGLYEMFDETDQIEASLNTTDMPSVAEQFTKLVASVSKRFNALKDKAANAETAQAELATIKEAIAQAEAAKAEEIKLEDRKTRLAAAGIEITDEKKQFYIEMPDTTFDQYITDLTFIMSKASAEQKNVVIVPEPVGSGTGNYTSKELAGYILADLNK